ncbi:MAG: DUF4827 domain-containing protein [Bacteroidaceae bacterium]|nr:DUF4827 domain-containing protein [Bacteroidaceae bacterium]
MNFISQVLNIGMLKDKLNGFLFLLLFALTFASCDKSVTYSEMKEKEREAVSDYINEMKINVIPYETFVENDYTTDVDNNEFVLVDDVYMQIINNPIKTDSTAYSIKDGDNIDLLVEFYEYNIQEGDTISGNLYAADDDEMRVTNNSGSYTATFTYGVMKEYYGSSVPTGWLVPLRFLTFTRKQSNLAKVKIIVPHTKGTSTAATYVYPCLYQIRLQPANQVLMDE